MLTTAVRTLRFGDYTLELRAHTSRRGNVIPSLKRGNTPVTKLEKTQLELLTFLAERAITKGRQPITVTQIYQALWGGEKDAGGNVQHHMTKLRKELGDSVPPYRYIATENYEQGYAFIAPVEANGDVGFIDGLLSWSGEHYHEMLNSVQPGSAETEDLRIINMGFLSIGAMSLERLLDRGVRIRIILTNPANETLIRARSTYRKDLHKTAPWEYYERRISENVNELEGLRDSYKDLIAFRFSDLMPTAFVTHSQQWAILGLYLAHKSYMNGPMIEVPGGSVFWKSLLEDWNLRWGDETPLINHPEAT